jgi:hypothetical protein
LAFLTISLFKEIGYLFRFDINMLAFTVGEDDYKHWLYILGWTDNNVCYFVFDIFFKSIGLNKWFETCHFSFWNWLRECLNLAEYCIQTESILNIPCILYPINYGSSGRYWR